MSQLLRIRSAGLDRAGALLIVGMQGLLAGWIAARGSH